MILALEQNYIPSSEVVILCHHHTKVWGSGGRDRGGLYLYGHHTENTLYSPKILMLSSWHFTSSLINTAVTLCRWIRWQLRNRNKTAARQWDLNFPVAGGTSMPMQLGKKDSIYHLEKYFFHSTQLLLVMGAGQSCSGSWMGWFTALYTVPCLLVWAWLKGKAEAGIQDHTHNHIGQRQASTPALRRGWGRCLFAVLAPSFWGSGGWEPKQIDPIACGREVIHKIYHQIICFHSHPN